MDKVNARGMISSQNIPGTAIYGPGGECLGHVNELLIDTRTGRIAYAIVGLGGILGLGEDEFPLPWGKLRHDAQRGAFVTEVTKERLQAAPARIHGWSANREWERVYFNHYGLSPYWI